MTPSRHAVASAALAAGCGLAWRSPEAAAAAFVGGTLLDVDHWFDYTWNRVGPFTVRRFVRLCVEYRLPKFYLLMHSFEWLIPFWLAAWMLPAPPWVRACTLGLILHMAMDMAGNGMALGAYWFVYRWRHGFDARAMVLRLPPEAICWWGSLGAYRRGRRSRSARGYRRPEVPERGPKRPVP
ncbi:MAG: hypothetical protein AAB152_13995 [Candidatus Coatesbacteria bacterium]